MKTKPKFKYDGKSVKWCCKDHKEEYDEILHKTIISRLKKDLKGYKSHFVYYNKKKEVFEGDLEIEV